MFPNKLVLNSDFFWRSGFERGPRAGRSKKDESKIC
jgi:hypothetical protein